MSNDKNFEVYVFFSNSKLSISVNKRLNFEKIYYNEVIIQSDSEKKISLEILNIFLNENIFKIEKLIKDFIKNIFFIIDLDNFFVFDMSIKGTNYDNISPTKIITYLLQDAKESCKSTIENREIIHMTIKKYLIGDEEFRDMPRDKDYKKLSLDIQFICLSKIFLKDLENILKNYQISLTRVFNAKHVQNSLPIDKDSIFLGAHQILNGHNENEVQFIERKTLKMGFFERFFQFFS